jgi:hypothetical protein
MAKRSCRPFSVVALVLAFCDLGVESEFVGVDRCHVDCFEFPCVRHRFVLIPEVSLFDMLTCVAVHGSSYFSVEDHRLRTGFLATLLLWRWKHLGLH